MILSKNTKALLNKTTGSFSVLQTIAIGLHLGVVKLIAKLARSHSELFMRANQKNTGKADSFVPAAPSFTYKWKS